MLKQQNWSIDEIDLVACGLGPGSFTGLRVGLANAKALAVSAGAAISGVSTLAAIARPVTALHSGPVVAAVDARRKEVYVGVYQDGPNGFECIQGDTALGPDALLELIESMVDPVLVGGGAQAYFKAGQLPAHIRSLGSGWDSPSPYSLGTLTRARVLKEGPGDIVTLEPNYIRPSDAEANLATRERARQSG
jgi:tRNA threonylcarbamoyladenosine biosynthesis protein TsaB